MLALAVALSIAGLAVGPALVALGRGRAVPSAAIEGLTLGVVPALILLRVLPHLYDSLGPWALVATATGYLVLWLADRRGHRAGARIGQAVIVPALALHALTDGAGLAVAVAAMTRGAPSGLLLGAVLLLHRLPEGLFVTTTLLPIVGWRSTLLRLGLVALATLTGALLGSALLATVPDALFDAVVALGLGAMLRLALHTHAPLPTERASRAASALAFAGGIVLALAVPAPDSVLRAAQPRELSITQSLGPLFVETAPALLAGLLLSALLHALLPQRITAWLRAGAPWQRALRGLAFGAARPWCACGVLPMSRRMFAEGISPAAVLPFVLGTPVLALDGVLVIGRLLGGTVMLSVVLGGVFIALAASVSTRGVAAPPRRRHVSLHVVSDEGAPVPATLGGRVLAGLREAGGAALDESGAWYLTGLVLAAAFEAASRWHFASPFGAPFDVAVVAALSMPFAIASHGAAPIAAVMVHKGFSPGAGLAMLLVAPSVSVALAATVRRALGARAAGLLVASVLVLATMLGVLLNLVTSADVVPAMHGFAAHVHPWWEWGSAGVLTVLLCASLVRVGPREWFGNMAVAGDEAEPGEHDHGHAHGHDHAPSEAPPYPAVSPESKG